MPKRSKALPGIVLTGLVSASLACSLAGPAATPTMAPTATAVPTEAVAYTPADARRATVQIMSEGTFVDPQVGFVANVVGAGSGFLISPDGLVVTNNHVVTGAARLEVWLDGVGYGARLLGASECWDLAVIQIDAKNQELPFLELYDGPLPAGTEVWAAGYPLGDPEFTLTSGIISKAETRANTSWASLDVAVEHDARINPGNSGGPLLNAAGQVVAVNYAVNAQTDQNFAIPISRAQRVIAELATGVDVDSIGINGQAVVSDDGSLAGIWVASVKSGSPADRAGLRAGDLVTRLEGITLARAGTVEEYCDVIRSQGQDDVLAIEVLRLEQQELLAGQINGRELEATYSFANALAGQVAGLPGDAAPYDRYDTVVDDTQSLRIAIPGEWTERLTGPQQLDTGLFPSILASSDLQGFADDASAPGLWFLGDRGMAGALDRLDSALDSAQPQLASACSAYVGRESYEDPKYVGRYVIYQDCGGSNNVFVIMVAASRSTEEGVFMMVAVNLLSQRDLDAFQRILNTFDFVGN
ncbi:MAG TPA: trypsin-like peptidase domain-containing protein [Anaerolineales bacterium]|nr:trypsin-like peptidase domain-containing protein [Anaerolineales bacterium]